MKTLGDTGLMPEKSYCSDCGSGCHCPTRNDTITEISAIPLLTVVRKAVEGGMVDIKPCKCVNIEYKATENCPDCNGTGFVIEEVSQ